METLQNPVSTLAPNEVFVFGSNRAGFHGAGAAGLACRGDATNTWRHDPWFQRALRSAAGSDARRGRWAVLGEPRGLQVGTLGRSYAIETLMRAGRRRSVSLREIYHQLVALADFARTQPGRRFLVTPLGEGLAGYSRDEMATVWRELSLRHGIPDSFVFIRLEAGARTAPRH